MKHIKAHAAKVHGAKEHKMTGGSIHHGSSHPGHAHGGAAHSDVAADRALIHRMVKPAALEHHAHGGKVKRPHSQVNVVVAPKGDQQPMPVPIPVPSGGRPMGAAPNVMPTSPLGGGMPPISPGGMPPLGGRAGPMKRGGHAHKHK